MSVFLGGPIAIAKIDVDNPEWANQNKDNNILEWAHSNCQIIMSIILNGSIKAEVSIFQNGPTAIAK
jgi:hypothetical protein